MIPDLLAGEIVTVLLLLVGVITLFALFGKDRNRGDVGVDIFEPPVDEDITDPSVETIDLALRTLDREASPEAFNWLLDKRIAAKASANGRKTETVPAGTPSPSTTKECA